MNFNNMIPVENNYVLLDLDRTDSDNKEMQYSKLLEEKCKLYNQDK